MNIISGILPYIQIALSALIIAAILLQHSEAGIGSAFGSDLGTSKHTRRGFEKTLFIATIVMAILFAISSFVALLLS